MADVQRTRPADGSRFGRDNILIWQVALVVGLLATWEVAGRLTGADQVSSPSRIIQTIMIWLGVPPATSMGSAEVPPRSPSL